MLSIDAVQNSDPTDMTKRVLAATALLATDGVSRQVLATVLDIDTASAHQLDTALARIVESSLAVWTADRRGIVVHRLVARAIRDQLQTAGELNASISSTVRGLQKLLVDEDRAWEQRHASTEIVAHAIDLWESIATAATRDPQTRDALENYTRIAHWAVRHLRATAEFARAIEIGSSALATCERILGPEHPDTLTSRNNLAPETLGISDSDSVSYKQVSTLSAGFRSVVPHGPGSPDRDCRVGDKGEAVRRFCRTAGLLLTVRTDPGRTCIGGGIRGARRQRAAEACLPARFRFHRLARSIRNHRDHLG
jgi:hypothetical protein